MKIIIDFDSINQEVVSVTVGDSVKTPTKPKGKKQIEINEKLQVTLDTNKLLLTPKLIELLKVKEGDRLVIRYKDDGVFIVPFLAPAKVFNEEGNGNKLTKASTVSFRGDQRDSLLKHGTIFNVKDMGDGSVKLIGESEIKGSVPVVTPETLEHSTNIGDDLELNQVKFIIK